VRIESQPGQGTVVDVLLQADLTAPRTISPAATARCATVGDEQGVRE